MTRGGTRVIDGWRRAGEQCADACRTAAARRSAAAYRWQGILAGLILIGASGSAAAQLAVPDLPIQTDLEQLSVAQRPRPDYDPLGIRVGSFLIFPTFGLLGTYDSNIFAAPNDVKGDFYTSLDPGVSVRSDWNNHSLNFVAGGDFRRYATQTSENENNGLAALTGRLDVQRDFYFLGEINYQLQHEDRSTPDTLFNQKNPTEYQQAGAALASVYNSGRIGLRLDGKINYFTYDNGITSLNVPIIETDRNRFEYVVTPRVSYEIIPGYSAFIKTPVNWVEYQSTSNQFGYNQSSHGYEFDAGTAVKITNLIVGEVYAGYLRQDFDGGESAANVAAGLPPLQPTSGVSFGGNLLWNITELTSLRGNLSRSVQQSYFIPAAGPGQAPPGSYTESSVSLTAEHELLRNVILNGLVGYINDAWQGNPRVDNSYQASLGVKYLINRYFNASLNASYNQRVSNVTLGDYTREIITARLNTQF